MRYITMAAFLMVAIIHLLPLVGVLGGDRLTALYGVAANEPNLAILMRHRAVLFGMLGVFLLCAAFQPALQPMAFVAGFVSVVSFLVLAWSVGGYNGQVARVVLADWVALAGLIVGLGAFLLKGKV